ncbi:Weak chloroplast movement under blue light 1-like isoform x1 [Thalictrum thalictroides]|uniref:Weak chloroplast movement under blue light 1-like isoform x1 n=1 Tax=Thalictrum thalictroides TaxID=46969 RepID=A0A7J6V987_THATH|nr:Weak chloroplast movement under blue light 1-like isoform x1 [Thalictrum thalictroides]
MMGEIDTKPIESVQTALSLFGEKVDQRKYRSTDSECKQRSEEWELMLTDLANYKVQVEVKEYAHKQALLKLESYSVTIDELSFQLKNFETERDQLIGDCREARTQIAELEYKVKEISYLLLEAGSAQEQLVHVINKLNVTQEGLHNVKAELATSEESKVSAMTQVEILETAVKLEREKSEELLRHVSELNEAVCQLKLTTIDAEKENFRILADEEDIIHMGNMEAVKAREQLEETREQIDMLQESENQLLAQSLFIESLQSELKQEKEFHSSFEQAASNDIDDMNQVRSELDLFERVNSDQASHIKSMETELRELRSELNNSKEEASYLSHGIEALTSEIEKAKNEMNEVSRRESEAQVEIALLKAEIHIGRSEIAAAEAAEARANSVKSGLYLAVKQLAIEAGEAKKETKMLKFEMEIAKEETGSFASVNQAEKAAETGSFTIVNLKAAECMQDLKVVKNEEPTSQVGVYIDDTNNSQITITMGEYESLIQKAHKANQVQQSQPEVATEPVETDSVFELHDLKKELEAAKVEIEKLRSVAVQAMNKAEQAEKAKMAIEGQLRNWREHKQNRRAAAIASLREESIAREINSPQNYNPKYEMTPKVYLPLSKILNMKV